MNECLREKARTAAGFEAFNGAAIDSRAHMPRGVVVKLQNQNQYRRISVGRPWPSENKKQNNKQHKYTAANIHVELLLVARTL